MDKKFLSGALILTIATFFSKLLGSLFRIPLQNIAGDEVHGMFTLIYPVYMAILTLSVAGIPLAISKLISEQETKKHHDNIYAIYRTALILGITFGIAGFSFMTLFSADIAEALGGRFVQPALIVAATTLLIAPHMAVYRGYMQGFSEMKPTAFSQVIEQFVRVFVILVLVIILVRQGRSPEMITAGVMAGSFVGALCSLIYLRKKHAQFTYEQVVKPRYSRALFFTWSKRILLLSLPICIGTLTMSLLNLVDSFTIPARLASHGLEPLKIAYYYGIYGRGITIVQIAVVFASALILPLVPLITKSLSENKHSETKAHIEMALKLTHLTSWPATIGLLALSLPINLALFLNVEGKTVLAIFSLSTLFSSFAILTTGILQGVNRAFAAAGAVIVVAFVKVVLNLLFVGEYGLMGAAYSTLITYMLLCVINLFLIHQKIPFTFFKRDVFICSFASIIAGGVVAFPQIFFTIEDWSRLVAFLYIFAAVVVAGSIYLLIIFAFKGVTKQELRALPFIPSRFSR